MRISLVLVLVMLLMLSSTASAECACKKAHSSDTTLYGGNEVIEMRGEHPYRSVRGKVTFGDSTGDSVEHALVELFSSDRKPTDEHSFDEESKRTRIRACWTQKDGRFCFGKLRPGFYEIRASYNRGMNVTYTFIEVTKQKSANSDEPLEIELRPGT